MKHYVIVCDESTRSGRAYSYFYGGAIVEESKYDKISDKLNMFKERIGIFDEIKRTKITLANVNKYIEMLDFFFTFVKSGDIRVRVMFSPNENLEILPKIENDTFAKFYYLFIRQAFALPFANDDINLRLIFDVLPETKEKVATFKEYLIRNLTHIRDNSATSKVDLSIQNIQEVDSKKHIILQMVDVIVGLIDFYVNDDQKKSKRWFAKHKIAEVLLSYIQEIHPNFDIYITTKPLKGHNAWIDRYKHFIYTKSTNKKAPALPT